MRVPFTIIFLLFVVGLSSVRAQTDTVSVPSDSLSGVSGEEYGFLRVECDSLGIDIYVDEMLVGQIPIDRPIPLPRGKHTVTYLHPGLVSLLNQYYRQEEIGSLIAKSFQTVYVVPGETMTVHLWWRPYERELKIRKRRFLVKSVVGAALLVTLLSLNLP